MSISLYLTARCATPVTRSEQDAVRRIIDESNTTRRPEWIAAYARSSSDSHLELYGNFECAHLEELGDDLTPPLILWGSAEMPLVDAWDEVVAPLLDHWCSAFSQIRRIAPAAHWRASLDDFKLEWDEAARRYRTPAELTPVRYGQSVRFSRGS